MNVYDLLARNAAKFPAKEALCCEDRRQTWQELDRRVLRLAGALAGRGIQKGDRVALFLENCDQFIEIYFAMARLGAVGVPLNYRLVGAELTFTLQNSGSRALFYGARWRETVAAVRGNLPLVELYVEVESGPYEEFLTGGGDAPVVAVREEDPNLVLYTSGTTGRPKGAVLSHANSVWNALNMVIECGFRHEDRCIIVPPCTIPPPSTVGSWRMLSWERPPWWRHPSSRRPCCNVWPGKRSPVFSWSRPCTISSCSRPVHKSMIFPG